MELEKAKHDKSKIGEDWIIQIVLNFFVAGSDTTSLSLSWIFLHLIIRPDIQEKLHKEIDDVLGGRQVQVL